MVKRTEKRGKSKKRGSQKAAAKLSHRQTRDKINSDDYKYKSLFDGVELSVVYLSPEGIILAINAAGARGFRGDPDDFVGKSVYKIIPRMADINRERIEKTIETGISEKYEDRVDFSTGTHWYSTSFHPVKNAQGELYAILVLSQDMTRYHKAEEQLRLLSSMVKQSTEGMALVDLDGNIQFLNQAFAEMHGYRPDELIGKNLAVFHTEEQMASVDAANNTIKETGKFVGEICHKHRDGTVFPTFMHNSLIRDESGRPVGIVGTLRDITLQKKADNALRESEEKFRQIINSAGNLIMVFDLDNRFLLVNNTCAEYFRVKANEIIGKSLHELLPDVADEFVERNKKVIETETGFMVEDQLQLPLGRRWFTSNLQPAKDAQGNIYGVLIISHDITERKMSEGIAKKTSEELEVERNALQEKNITLKQVLSHIDDDRRDFLSKIQKEIGRAVLPLLKRLRKKLEKSYSGDIMAMEMALKAVLAQDRDNFRVNYSTLTARQSEICELIKKGLSSKEISAKLNLSLLTVFKHREQIRKKLEITNKNIGLATYLRSHI